MTISSLHLPNDPAVTDLRIILPKNGRSFLSIAATGSGASTFARTSSYRYREARLIVGGTEWLLEKHDEVVVNVAASDPQSIGIEGFIDGERLRTIVDRVRLLTSGVRQICECKPDWASFFQPRAIKQRLLGQAAAEALGWDWVAVVPETLGSRTFRANVDRIYASRMVRVPGHLAHLALELLQDGPMPLGELTRRLHVHDGNAFAIACSMMVRRIVEIDLTMPLGHASPVRLAPPIPSGLPSIRLRRGSLDTFAA